MHSLAKKSDSPVRVQHHSEGSTHGSGREVLGELGSDGAAVAVSLDDSTPNDSESCVVSHVLGLVHVGNALSEVEGGVSLVVDALDLQESELLVLGGSASLEAGEGGFLVESTALNLTRA